ncbi:MAG: bifunctional metallophosphatase/5'-nucleotidase [Sphingobacteriales bacterium]|nr:bifunctional metallophosphatase/5'-nucleotidase [Sphingobacteriales bacterium]MCC7224071.1 bifunctional metallophosphatase/5'-nucleotidase [Chitinophagales bacterium]
MKLFFYVGAFCLLLAAAACTSSKKTGTATTAPKPKPQKAYTRETPTDDGMISLTFLQINDVYEIGALSEGKVGGMPRVATLKKRLQQKNPNTFTVLAGDFLSPSLLGTIKHEGKRIKGKQMVDAMNVAGVDLVTFGNHEFDIKEEELLERLDESNFTWVSGNVRHRTKAGTLEPFMVKGNPVPDTHILHIKDADGTSAKVGIIGLTLPANKADFVWYGSVDSAATAGYNYLKDKTDFVVAITHLNMNEDLALANKMTGVRLSMGGHEHNNMMQKFKNLIVAKADANAKTAYVHQISFNKAQPHLGIGISSKLTNLDELLPEDAATKAVVDKWQKIGDDNMKSLGFDPADVVMTLPKGKTLDGREQTIRNIPCELPQLVAKAMSAVAPKSVAAIMNSGSIRIDDELSGKITQYDILRALPFGGSVVEVDMKGSLLKQVLDIGKANKGSGGFLQHDRIAYSDSEKQWLLGGKAIKDSQSYRIALGDFLLTGMEKGLPFLTKGNPEITQVYAPNPDDKSDLRNDVRLALIDYLKKTNTK